MLISFKDRLETAVLGEVFYEPSTAPFRYERERVLKDINTRRLFKTQLNKHVVLQFHTQVHPLLQMHLTSQSVPSLEYLL